MTIADTPKTAHITGWDRMVVIALGGAGCALSYDSLQQMAVAIHVRGLLTYLFPLVIDGFIAYGVRALLVLRDAPLHARLYVWTLFGTATAASIWANALHAVRLNEESLTTTHGLRLGDTVVAVLSTIAPLALAGAVHLYILIARGSVKAATDRRDRLGGTGQLGESGPLERVPVTRTDRARHPHSSAGQATGEAAGSVLIERRRLSPDKGHSDTRSLTGTGDQRAGGQLDSGHPGGPEAGADRHGEPGTAPAATDHPADRAPVTGRRVTSTRVSDRPVAARPVTDLGTPVAAARRTVPDTEELLDIAREAVKAEEKLTRKVVAQAIRGQQIPLSSDTLTALMIQLRQQDGQVAASSRN